MEIEKIRNVCLISHGGAGKTTLAESMLFEAQALDRKGSIEAGTTLMDFLPEEIKRKMTISASCASFQYNGFWITLLDTPGYLDFIAEVIRVLHIVDGVIVVVDACSGVEVGTEMGWKWVQRYNLPCLFFINKLDKENSQFQKALESVKEAFGKNVLPIQLPLGEGVEFKGIVNLFGDVPEEFAKEKEALIEIVAEMDDALLEKYLNEASLSNEEIIEGIRKGCKDAKIIPLLCGSAQTGAGIPELLNGIINFLPSPAEHVFNAENALTKERVQINALDTKPFTAQVFKVVTDPYIGELTYLRVMSGKIESGDEVLNSTKQKKDKVTHLCTLFGKERRECKSLSAGQIGALLKFRGTSTADTLCAPSFPVVFEKMDFPQPVISIAVNPCTKQDQEKLSTALSRLAEEDPTFLVRLEHELHQTIIWGMGEVHLDLAVQRLVERFGVKINLEQPRIPYRETIRKKVTAEGKYKRQSGGRGQYGHTFLEIEPLPPGGGFEFTERIFGGVIPAKYFPAVEKGVRDTMQKGILAGYPIVDVKVTLYDGSFHEVDSSDIAFQIAASIAFKKAFEQADPVLLEPIMEVEVTCPEDCMGDVINDISGRRGKILGVEAEGTFQKVKAYIPQAELFKYSTVLRSITGGRATFVLHHSHYEQVPPHIQEKIIQEAKERRE